MSQSSLTSDLDPQDKDRWWRSIERLNQTHPQPPYSLTIQHAARPSDYVAQSQSPTLARARTHGGVRGASNEELGAGRGSKTQPGTPALEKDFMFNGAEDVESFMRKTKRGLGGR
jgi:hypothetical protein